MQNAWLLGALLAAGLGAAAPNFPALTGRVVDAAGILSDATETELTQRLEAYERGSRQQIVVATVPDLGGLDIADYGYQLGRTWGIGGKTDDTGSLLIVAAADRKVRIEVGYGLEGELTDAMSAQIIQTRILPAFRKGDFDAGVRAGVDAMIGVLSGEQIEQPAAETVKKVIPSAIFWLILLFVVFSSFGRRRRGGLARALFWGSVLNGMSGGRGRGGGGFRGGGGGGFRGGGGSFGGGGASGGW